MGNKRASAGELRQRSCLWWNFQRERVQPQAD